MFFRNDGKSRKVGCHQGKRIGRCKAEGVIVGNLDFFMWFM
jgi:hypothetical protein